MSRLRNLSRSISFLLRDPSKSRVPRRRDFFSKKLSSYFPNFISKSFILSIAVASYYSTCYRTSAQNSQADFSESRHISGVYIQRFLNLVITRYSFLQAIVVVAVSPPFPPPPSFSLRFDDFLFYQSDVHHPRRRSIIHDSAKLISTLGLFSFLSSRIIYSFH